MRKIIVYYNPNRDCYYFRTVRCYYRNYEVGEKNQYGHEVILIIDIDVLTSSSMSLKEKLITRFILFLERIK